MRIRDRSSVVCSADLNNDDKHVLQDGPELIEPLGVYVRVLLRERLLLDRESLVPGRVVDHTALQQRCSVLLLGLAQQCVPTVDTTTTLDACCSSYCIRIYEMSTNEIGRAACRERTG